MLHKNTNNNSSNKSTIVIHLLSRGNQSGEDRQCHDSASGATRQWPEKRRVDRETSRHPDKQTSRRYQISGSFIGSRIKQSQQCPRKEFAKRVEQLSESKHLFGIPRRNNNKTTKPKRISTSISLPEH